MKHSRVITLLLALSALYACSRQGEGDACFVSNGNNDCDSGLVCTAQGKLAEETKLALSGSATDRCCPSDGNSTNIHCKLKTSTDTVTETGGAAGSGGAAEPAAGTTAAGGKSSSTSGAGATSTAGASAVGGSATGGASTGT